MDKNEFLQIRECRCEIIRICQKIYDFDFDRLDIEWKDNLEHILWKNIKEKRLLLEANNCVCKKNWIRFRDMLIHLDDILREKLKDNFTVKQSWHYDIWDKNFDIIKKKNEKIADLLKESVDRARIDILDGGTEGYGIRIHEKQSAFNLFSMENPWLESANFLRGKDNDRYHDIFQFGFGGGFVTGWLNKIFPESNLYVYIPNMDIFKAVLQNICLDNILTNKKLNFIYDPSGLEFLKKINNSHCPDSGIFIDYNELRALTGSLEVAEKTKNIYKKLISQSRKVCSKEKNIGHRIYSIVKNQSMCMVVD